jgi:hypothetical protein
MTGEYSIFDWVINGMKAVPGWIEGWEAGEQWEGARDFFTVEFELGGWALGQG